MIVTIDGPAGSGKSTVARALARDLGIAYLDTGATYRAVTWKALRDGVDLADEAALTAVARSLRFELAPAEGGPVVRVDGRDVSRAIRSQEVTNHAHYAARSPRVRAVLVDLQRRLGAELGSFVSEGRDQGSVVFPEADAKVYLDADMEVRARRRLGDLRAAGEDADYETVLAELQRRDERDRGRSTAPLIRPAGAIEIDSTHRTVAEVVAEIRRRLEARP